MAYKATALPDELKEHTWAGTGNRTQVTSLENWHSTIELHLLYARGIGIEPISRSFGNSIALPWNMPPHNGKTLQVLPNVWEENELNIYPWFFRPVLYHWATSPNCVRKERFELSGPSRTCGLQPHPAPYRSTNAYQKCCCFRRKPSKFLWS